MSLITVVGPWHQPTDSRLDRLGPDVSCRKARAYDWPCYAIRFLRGRRFFAISRRHMSPIILPSWQFALGHTSA